jgi:hypothetical protein
MNSRSIQTSRREVFSMAILVAMFLVIIANVVPLDAPVGGRASHDDANQGQQKAKIMSKGQQSLALQSHGPSLCRCSA